MRTVRRIYTYAVALISLEVVIWGTIALGRSLICSGRSLCGNTGILSSGLAAVIVGIPFFLIHWSLAQRLARREADERTASVRAIFLHAVLLATLIPIVQNLLAFLDHLTLGLARLGPERAMFSPNQTWTDNFIAILVNGLFAAYFLTILRANLRAEGAAEAFAPVHRLYRFIWLTYSLALVVACVDQLLRFILDGFILEAATPAVFNVAYRTTAAHGLALAVVGVPLWVFLTSILRSALADPQERASLLRLGMLYVYSLAGVTTVLAAAGLVVDVFLRLGLGESMTWAGFIGKVAGPFSIAVPLGGVWAYYGRQLGWAIAGEPEATRRSGMLRLYAYILSAIGLAAAFVGLAMLLEFVVDASFGQILWADTLRLRLAAALATLLVGLPLWLLSWLPMQREALAAGDAGDHARRSILRRVYLYLALFAGVVGGMVVAVGLVSLLLRSIFGLRVDNLLQQALKGVELLVVFAGLGMYHGLLLRQDGRMAAEALAEKHAAFPALVFESPAGAFAETIRLALQKQAPRLPVTVQPAGAPPVGEVQPRAVVLPSDLALEPPESLRQWLIGFRGSRLVVPWAAPARPDVQVGWMLSSGVRPPAEAAMQAAQAIRLLAEGQGIPQEKGRSGWVVVGYIAAVFLGLQLLGALIALGVNLLGG